MELADLFIFLDTLCQLLMTRKNTMDVFFNGEIENELQERKMGDKVY